ncbi:hypothetical protein AAY473_030437 [Plecturocebus cupreus]
MCQLLRERLERWIPSPARRRVYGNESILKAHCVPGREPGAEEADTASVVTARLQGSAPLSPPRKADTEQEREKSGGRQEEDLQTGTSSTKRK